MRAVIAVYLIVVVLSLTAATQWVAYRLMDDPRLGPNVYVGAVALYAPWAIFAWASDLGDSLPDAFDEGYAVIGGGLVLATLVLVIIRHSKRRLTVRELGRDRWASRRDMKAAGLLGGKGTVLGIAHRRFLTYDGPEHQLVSGASRSGKGVGHVIPTLLNWNSSVLVYDVKNELWDVTAGFRSRFSHVVFFNPTRPDSVRFNPLMEIRKGSNEVRDTQNVVEMLVNPAELEQSPDIWDQQASQFLVALILHVLYTEPDGRKNLAVVRERLLDFKRTCQTMLATAHRFNPRTGVPEVHPEVGLVANEMLHQPEKFQASVRGTAATYLTLFADDLVAQNTAVSDFRLGDLVCADRPMTLYLQPPPSDAPRLRCLVRLMINQACRALMEYLERDNMDRPKRRPLLLLLDEFPTLGHMEFFSMNLRQMAGYGIKAHLIVQSFNDIIEAYGQSNTILDNCHILTAFAAADTVTCQRISQITGTVTEYRESYSEAARHLGAGTRTVSFSEHVRPLLSPGDVRELPMDDQLVFVTGYKPMRVKKLRYYAEPTFLKRVLPPPDQSQGVDIPGDPVIAWQGERAKAPIQTVPNSKWRDSRQPLFGPNEDTDLDDGDDDAIRGSEPQ